MTQSQDESIRTALRENGRRLRDFIRSRVAEPEDAEDIFQDVVLELTSAYRLMQPIEKMAAGCSELHATRSLTVTAEKRTS